MIDWNNKNAKVSKYFTVGELTYLPSWDTHHTPSDVEKDNLITLALVMDHVRAFLGLPINVHCAIRPVLNNPSSNRNGEDYNAFIGGAPSSAHKANNDSAAMDFDCGENCDETRKKLLPKLKDFNIRMENKRNSTWIHIDTAKPSPNRFFKP